MFLALLVSVKEYVGAFQLLVFDGQFGRHWNGHQQGWCLVLCCEGLCETMLGVKTDVPQSLLSTSGTPRRQAWQRQQVSLNRPHSPGAPRELKEEREH